MNDVTPPKKLSEVVQTFDPSAEHEAVKDDKRPVELGGPKGPEPTRYGDWEKKGRCVDF